MTTPRAVRCAGCGYPEDTHDIGTRQCHPATADKNGRRGKFRAPEPVPRRNWHGLLKPMTPDELAALSGPRTSNSGPPQVPARMPAGPQEFAGAGRRRAQAVAMGHRAVAAGWSVTAKYWRAHDGAEGCGVWMARGDLRALATWKRKPVGGAWTVDCAYAWRQGSGRMPSRINHTELERLINDSAAGSPEADHASDTC